MLPGGGGGGATQRGRGSWGGETGVGGREIRVGSRAPRPHRLHLGTIRPRIVWIWSRSTGDQKLYVIFSYTRDPPCSPDGFNHRRKKAALLVCMKSRSWESLGKTVCTAHLPSNKPKRSFRSAGFGPRSHTRPKRH